jgi:hypothetical protein
MARLAPHPSNAVAMGAIALYAGAKLPRRWAFLVPLAAMALSDLYLDWGTGQPIFTPTRLSIYACFALIVAAGRLIRLPATPGGRFGAGLGLSLGASTLFFVVTNFVVWISPQVATTDHPAFAATLSGLLQCYAGAIPFYRNALAADLTGMAVLFGVDWAAAWAWARTGRAVTAPPLVVE